MIGTLINVATIVLGSIFGILIGTRLSTQLRETVVSGLGLFTLAYGIMSFLETANPLVPLGGLLIGALLGEWWQVEEHLAKLGEILNQLVNRGRPQQGTSSKFVEGFVTASLVFVIGPIAILGAIQDGVTGNYEMLTIKAILDGFASIAFASSLGIGVGFSALSILIYQGGISLMSGLFSQFFSPAMITEMTAVGGLVLISVSLSSLLKVKKIRTGSFLPGLLVTPLIMLILERFFGG
ncbi:MAG: DUF554 domain-containing protein [Chloroflexi bacterium]|jgi:uncharacterized membrane protein YqgA involved in biofilm formation|nr:DUF554 domain-containing protein [Chloroflexota bacterium]